MKTLAPIIAAASAVLALTALSTPLAVSAQAVKPADTPRTDLEKTQTTETGQATKYGSPGTDTGGSPSDGKMSSGKHSMKAHTNKSPGSAAGDASSTASPTSPPSSATPSGTTPMK